MTLLDLPTQPVPSGLVNFRDVADLVDGVPRGVLLRSDAPHSTDLLPEQLEAAFPVAVIDLRDDLEKTEAHPFGARARIVDLPLLGGAANEPHSFPSSLGELYAGMLDGDAAAHLVTAVETIAGASGPVLVHCAAGKDRTGVAIAVALRLAGADREQIVVDYTQTHAAMAGVFARMALTSNMRTQGAALAEIPEEFAGAPRVAIEAFLDALDAREGGAEGWFLAAGGSAETIAAVRTRLSA